MKRLLSLPSYLAAFLLIPVALAVFIALPQLTNALVAGTGLRVSPWFTGGEVIRRIEHPGYQTLIHKPVFDGLFAERREGFVQIDWSEKDKVPARIEECIDYDGDGRDDFKVNWQPRLNEPTITGLQPEVLGLRASLHLDAAFAIRVALRSHK